MLTIISLQHTADRADTLQKSIACHIKVGVKNQLATTKVDQDFTSIRTTLSVGRYVYLSPLPDDAVVSKLALSIDGEVSKWRTSLSRTIATDLQKKYPAMAVIKRFWNISERGRL